MADLSDITIGLKVDDGDVVRSLKTFERMKRQIGDLIIAERKGEITKKQYNRAIQQMGVSLGKVTKDVNGAKSAIQKYAFAVKDATDEQLKLQVASGKGMRRFELIAQQAGYQFGDLAVQIQSGTNAAVALGQQGSQLLGFFGPYGALAGAGLAIVTGLIAPLLKAKEQAEDLTEALEGLRESEGLIESLGNSIDKNLVGKFEVVRKEFGSLVGDIYKFQAESLQKALTASFSVIKSQAVGMAGIGGYGPSAEQMSEREAQVSGILGGIGGDTTQEIAKSVQEAYDKLSKLPFITKQAKENFRQIALDNGIITDLVDSQEEGLERQVAKRKKLQQIQTDAMAMEAEIAQEAQEAQKALIADLFGSLDKQVERANEFYDVAITGQEELNELASKLGERLGIGFAEGLEIIRQAKAEASVGLDAFGGSGEFKYSTSSTYKPPAKTKTKTTGGGRSTKEILADLQKQINLEKYLVDASDARKRVVQAVGETYARNNPQIIEGLTEQIQAIKDIEAQEAKRIKTLEEAAQKQKEMQDFISQSFESGFMSIIDGTQSVKDAFRSMARDIIAELYRVLVVKKLVSSATGFFGFADGGVFQGGSQVQAFANGGVVGGPTYFPMSGGQTGLMGEAGPEAIMPLKRGKDGKLGVEAQGGGSITVNQTINVSTGVQQTVRTEIKSLMPQIAESAKAAVADAKRRGGSYGRAF